MGVPNNTLKVVGTINNSPTTTYNTQIAISPVNFVVSKLKIEEVGVIWDSVIDSVNGQIEIEYGKEYTASVVEYRDTISGKTYKTSDNPDRQFIWHLEYEKYETSKIIETSKKTGEIFEFKLQKYYMANDKIELCVRVPYYETIFKFELKVKFKFEFERKKLVDDVIKCKKSPASINQPGPLCGIAAPCYIWAKHHKDEYAETILELHAMGKVKVNDFMITPDSHLYKLKTSKIPLNGNIADWILMASIRDSENTFVDYGDTESESYAGITTANTVENILKKMCKYSIIDSDTYLGLLNKIPPIRWTVKGVKERIEKIDNYYVKKGYEILLMIDSDIIYDERSLEPDYHWVVYQGNLVRSDNHVKFNVYSWASTNWKVDDSYERIRRNWYQYLVVKCIK